MTLAIASGAAVRVPSIRLQPGGRRLRPACRADARAIAELMAMAGDGIPDYLWGQAAMPGESRIDVGTRRAARDEGTFCWMNATLAERREAVVGMMLGYRLDDTPASPETIAGLPAVVRPFVELEQQAPGAFYVNALAVRPGHRGLGIGGHLLEAARDRARGRGATLMAITAFEQNAGAVRLYQRHGYRIVDRRPVVPHPCHPYGGDAVLMVREA